MTLLAGLKAVRRAPLFPLIPILPLTLVTGCIAMNIANYRRLQRLERRLDEAEGLGAARPPAAEPVVATRSRPS